MKPTLQEELMQETEKEESLRQEENRESRRSWKPRGKTVLREDLRDLVCVGDSG